MTLSKIAVIGSGVMGSGIAAHITNAGVPVVLLDIKLPEKDLAKDAVARMLKADPAPFMRPENAKLITTGNLEDDVNLLKDCDWIIEVVLEDLKVKHKTYETIEKVRKKGAVVSSNTSTIPLQHLIDGRSKDFAAHFMITHFFNPPRYMRLLELVTGPQTDAKAAANIREFCDVRLGKGVVVCKDTPGFIANRLGVYWLTAGVNEAIKQNVSVEIADAVMSKPVGIPKTGVFGLIDLVGIDLMPKLEDSLLSTLPQDDLYRSLHTDHPFIKQMIAGGYTGRKGKGGFYRLDPTSKAKDKQALKLRDGKSFAEDHYTKSEKAADPAVDAGKAGLRAVLEANSSGGRYARAVLLQTLHYAASLAGEIADTVQAIDEGMRWGYNWKAGPFEMIDQLGAAWFAQALQQEGLSVPKIVQQVGDGQFYRIHNGAQQFFGLDGQYHDVVRAPGVLLLSDIKLKSQPVLKNSAAKVWDIGDGVLCFEHTSKMNTFEEGTFDLLEQTIKTIGDGKGQYKALVVYNESSNFSAGANLGIALFMINIAMWPQVEGFIARGQKVFTDLKFAPFPTVGAPSGMALGGGCEILLASDAVQAHAETYVGLVEVGVGVIPGWGGCKEMILRLQEREQEAFNKSMSAVKKESLWFSPPVTPMGATRKAFETIGTATVAKSAFEAQDIGYFRTRDGVTMNRDRLLFDAKQKALQLAQNYQPPMKREDIRLPGASGKLALEMAVADLQKSGKATPYDGVVSAHLADVLTGGTKGDWSVKMSEDDILKLELAQFMHLLKNEGTLARIEHMLDKGKPLRN
ncbi:MAG: 3-hydroxyacyl-CoA dehydrogenase/enoyl-CoA hydratase family protein [Alphaproteobacteria bacterium]|nr:3-hydroxyacyl-CoA dehydrogenase/enoyl-CoA hydratase family protein [Alphaproteobacteria bacterium]